MVTWKPNPSRKMNLRRKTRATAGSEKPTALPMKLASLSRRLASVQAECAAFQTEPASSPALACLIRDEASLPASADRLPMNEARFSIHKAGFTKSEASPRCRRFSPLAQSWRFHSPIAQQPIAPDSTVAQTAVPFHPPGYPAPPPCRWL
jgi:hypothetical protein